MAQGSVSKEDLERIKEGYLDLFVRKDDPTANHHVERILILRQEYIRQASQSNDPNEAFGLLKTADGIIKVLEDIETYTSKRLRRD